MNNKQIKEKFNQWWADVKTCSGKPHCDVEECDLCITCFDELLHSFGLKYQQGKIELISVLQQKNSNKNNSFTKPKNTRL